MRRTVYFALLNSQIMYGISVWGSSTNLSTLFAAQKKAIRTLFNIPRISRYCPGHTKYCMNNNKILIVHNLYYAYILNSLFLALYSNPPKPIMNQIKPHLSITNSNYFILPKLKLTILQKNLPYIGNMYGIASLTSLPLLIQLTKPCSCTGNIIHLKSLLKHSFFMYKSLATPHYGN